MTQHIVAKGPKAGTWATCTAKRACRNGGMHIEDEELHGALLWQQSAHPDRVTSLIEITPSLIEEAAQDARFPSFVFEARLAELNELPDEDLQLSRRTKRTMRRDNPLTHEDGHLQRKFTYLRLPKALKRAAEAQWSQLQPKALPLSQAFFDYYQDEEPNLAQAQMYRAHRFEAMDVEGKIADFFVLGEPRTMTPDEYDAFSDLADVDGRP